MKRVTLAEGDIKFDKEEGFDAIMNDPFFFGDLCFTRSFAGLLGEVIVGEDVGETGVEGGEITLIMTGYRIQPLISPSLANESSGKQCLCVISPIGVVSQMNSFHTPI